MLTRNISILYELLTSRFSFLLFPFPPFQTGTEEKRQELICPISNAINAAFADPSIDNKAFYQFLLQLVTPEFDVLSFPLSFSFFLFLSFSFSFFFFPLLDLLSLPLSCKYVSSVSASALQCLVDVLSMDLVTSLLDRGAGGAVCRVCLTPTASTRLSRSSSAAPSAPSPRARWRCVCADAARLRTRHSHSRTPHTVGAVVCAGGAVDPPCGPSAVLWDLVRWIFSEDKCFFSVNEWRDLTTWIVSMNDNWYEKDSCLKKIRSFTLHT